MIDTNKPDYEVVVIGGGPAGSTAASLLAREGVKVLVLEREKFPRPHVGESLVPATNKILRSIGMLEAMEKSNFPRKYGAAWTSAAMKSIYSHDFENIDKDYEVDIAFAETNDGSKSQVHSYHVDRAKFDDMLLKHSRSLGADVLEETAVVDFDLDAQPFVEVKIREKDKTERVITCNLLMDASGRRTVLGQKLGLKAKDTQFDQNAIHAWFEGYPRDVPGKEEFIFIHFLPKISAWVWQIPITETVTSFGVVTPKKYFKGAKEEREDFFWDCISSRPELYEKLKGKKVVQDFTVETDYSYSVSQIAGDRWCIVGDAARFVDPIFSSGISIAMTSSEMAVNCILEKRKMGTLDYSRETFAAYEQRFKWGCDNWYKFISIYYRLNVLFTYFVEHEDYRLDVIRLLSGEVYSEEEPSVLQKMRDIITEVENNPGHIWHRLLNEVRSDAFGESFQK